MILGRMSDPLQEITNTQNGGCLSMQQVGFKFGHHCLMVGRL